MTMEFFSRNILKLIKVLFDKMELNLRKDCLVKINYKILKH